MASNGHGVSAAAKSRRSPKGAGDIRGGRHGVAAAGFETQGVAAAGLDRQGVTAAGL